MRKDVGVDGDAQRIGQLVWLLFLKIFDDREQEWELLDDAYRSPLPEQYRWRNWAADPEGITGDELKSFIDNELFPALQKLESYSTTPAAFVVRGVFEDAYNYMKSGQLIRQVINKIQEGVDFNKAQERHAFGDMYEQLLRDLQSAGNAGEFYTPRPVTEFMVRMVNPKLDEKVMDPACGTGGFLTCTIEHKRKHYVKTPEDERVLQASIHGVEKKPLPHLLATTNMILHGIEVPNQIRHDNTLAKPLIGWGPKDRVDCIVANPPFGGMEEDGIETNFPAAFRTRETADLFLVLIMHLLRDGGRAAVVLPDGFLFGEGIKSRIKEKLVADCNLHTIVRLPNGVFNRRRRLGQGRSHSNLAGRDSAVPAPKPCVPIQAVHGQVQLALGRAVFELPTGARVLRRLVEANDKSCVNQHDAVACLRISGAAARGAAANSCRSGRLVGSLRSAKPSHGRGRKPPRASCVRPSYPGCSVSRRPLPKTRAVGKSGEEHSAHQPQA